MNKTLLWLQAGACGGDSMALLCAETPSIEELLADLGLRLLWHPSLSLESPAALERLTDEILAGTLPLDILCVEGSIMTGPEGTGLYDPYRDGSTMELIYALAQRAAYVVAMGTCAAFGGIHAAPPNPTDCVGLQFQGALPGGLLPAEWRSRAGLPAVNVPGCPTHPETMCKTLHMLSAGMPVELDALNRPEAFFNTLAHQGCTRNESHEYNVEDRNFGQDGCLFYFLGCQAPYTMSLCNTDLWNGQSSKPRAGVPCFGCTSPEFPLNRDLFLTEKIGPIPVRLPLGVDRANYMAYKSLARDAAPERVAKKEQDI